MKIIKEGKPKEVIGKIIKRVGQFECSVCGFVFEADDIEYKHQFDQKDGTERWTGRCPNCGELATLNALEFRVRMLKSLK